MDALFGYKTMPEGHKNNLKSYYIYNGIYSAFYDISDDDAKFIHDICMRVDNENINPFSISYYLAEKYTLGILSKEQLENAKSGEIVEAVYYNNLNYIKSNNKEIEVAK